LKTETSFCIRLICLSVLAGCLAGSLHAQVDTAWSRLWDDPANDNDQFIGVATDDSGNVYAAGYAGTGYPGDMTFVAVKYLANGTQSWQQQYNPTGLADEATAMALDRAHNLILTGYTGGSTYASGDWATTKYSPAGDLLWARTYSYGTQDRPNAVAVDDSGNVYVTGELGAYPILFCATIKYSPTGDQQWEARYYAGAVPLARGQAIAADLQGNCYVAGASNSTGWDIAVIKYDPQGDTLWTATYDGPAHDDDISSAIAVDAAGNCFVGGQSMAASGVPDAVVIKLNAQGAILWTQRYDGPAHRSDAVRAMVLDHSGNVYVTGYSAGTGGNSADILTIKYLADGSWGWGARYDGPVHGPDQGTAIARDSLGNTFVAGYSWGHTQDNDAMTLRYDTVGRLRGTARYNNSASEAMSAVAIDPSNNAVSAGYTTNFSEDGLIIKYRHITGIEEEASGPVLANPEPVTTITNGVLRLPAATRGHPAATSRLLDITGKEVMKLHSGPNDVHVLAPGVYFVSLVSADGTPTPAKVIITR
jgi:hypothetical protein